MSPVRLSFAQKLVLMPLLAGVAFLVVFVTTHLAGARYAELNVQIESGYSPALGLSRDLEGLLTRAQRGLQGAVAASDETLLAEPDAARVAFATRVAAERDNPVLDPRQLDGISSLFDGYYALARSTSLRMIHGETGEDLASSQERMRLDYNRVRDELKSFTARQQAAMDQAFAAAKAGHRRSLIVLTATTVVCILLLGAISTFTVRSLTARVQEALRVVDQVALDQVTQQVGSEAQDELGRLLFGLRAMAHRVEHREEALKASEERYALAALGANDGLWDWDLLAHAVYYSARWKGMLGYAEAEIGHDPKEWLDRVHSADRATVEAKIQEHLDGATAHLEVEHRIRAKDGTWRWVLNRAIAVRDDEGRPHRMAGSQSDITERKAAEEQLLRDAFLDALTGLPNRALFVDRLATALRRAKRDPQYLLAVVFLDVDRFKLVNDSLGHDAGDELLKAISVRLQACLRPGDTVARFGGDEFTLLLEDLGDLGKATRVADRIRSESSLPFRLGGQEIFASVSMGIALGSSRTERAEDLLRDADNALHRAKAAGRSRYELFDTQMHRRAVNLLRLESELRRAVDRGEFRLHYQPIVALDGERLAGFEALVRWMHPDRGVVGPTEFIHLAEETGLIVPLGNWVLREVCRQMTAWDLASRPGTPLAVSANLSTRQFAQADLVGQVRQAMEDAGGVSHLHLEVTESAVMENGDAAAQTLARLKELGIRISIDDFGTGYSSLSYLRRLPIDTLKIDQSFVKRMGNGSRDSEIVRTIVDLAHNLGMSVVAEGVDEAAQVEQLRRLGCDYAQGFLFSEPVDETAAGRMVSEGRVSGGSR